MFWYNLKITYRNLIRNRSFSVINLLGLTIGISTCIVIFLFVYDELEYGQDHPQKDQMYRILRGGEDMSAITSGKLLPLLESKIPAIEDAVRVRKRAGVISFKNKRFNENTIVIADSNFMDFFQWELMQGDVSTALNEVNSIIITQEMARKYFGDSNPMGKILRWENDQDLVVRGIFKESKPHHPIQLDFLINIEILRNTGSNVLKSWDNNSLHTYIRLQKNADPNKISNLIPVLVGEARGYEEPETANYQLQPFPEIYLNSVNIGYDFYDRGDINVVYTFLAIAILVLLLACFNYMNLSTVQSAKRAREIGLRKTVGSNRTKLIYQFLLEAFLLSFLAVLISLIMVEVLMPWFNQLMGKNLSLYNIDIYLFIPAILALIILVAFLGGFYPSFVISSFKPVTVMKANSMVQHEVLKKRGKGISVKQIIIVLQLACTIGLIIGSIVISEQLKYARNKDLGHNPDQLIVVNNIWVKGMLQRFKNIERDLEQYPEVINVTGAYNIPGENINNWSRFTVSNGEEEVSFQAAYVGVEKDFFKVLEAKIIEGRDFADNNIHEQNSYCIINEATLDLLQLGDKSPLNVKLKGFWDSIDTRSIIGVVNNIHNKSLHETPPPVVYRIAEDSYPYYFYKILIKVRPENISHTVAKIEETWNKYAPEWPIQMRFISQQFENMYLSEKKVSKLMTIFTFLAIYISLSGLFGLIAFMAVSRKKEIGIRKTLGASVSRIVTEMGREFMWLTLIANFIAWPLIYFAATNWLQKFADSVSISFLWFFIAGIAVLILVMLVVVYHAVRSANQNPVDALKYE